MNNVEYYNLLSLISLVMFVILSVMAVIMWFKLDVRHYMAVLTGSEARRSIDKIKKDAESGAVQADRRRRNNKAVVSWNTSEGLDYSPSGITRNPYMTGAPGYDPDKTVVLGQPDPYATVVLSQLNNMDQNPIGSPAPAQSAPSPAPVPSVRRSQQQDMPSPGDFAKPPFDFVVEKEITNSAGKQ